MAEPADTPMPGPGATDPSADLVVIATGVDRRDRAWLIDDLRNLGLAATGRSAGGDPDLHEVLVPATHVDAAHERLLQLDTGEPTNWFEEQPIWARAAMLVAASLITVVVLFLLALVAL